MASIEGGAFSQSGASCVLNAQPGDMIEFDRGLYSHWGIYVGENTVIHRWGEDDGAGQSTGLKGSVRTVSGKACNKAKIVKSSILEVMGSHGKAKVNNHLDREHEASPVNVIIERAESALDQEGYNLIFYNCEHFATYCRYGKKESRQEKRAASITAVATGLVVAASVAGVAVYRGTKSSRKALDDTNEFHIKANLGLPGSRGLGVYQGLGVYEGEKRG